MEYNYKKRAIPAQCRSSRYGNSSGGALVTLSGIGGSSHTHSNLELLSQIAREGNYLLWGDADSSLEKVSAGYADAAGKLDKVSKLWGQEFDGTKDVTGSLDEVEDIVMTGTLKIGAVSIYYDVVNDSLRIGKSIVSDGDITAMSK